MALNSNSLSDLLEICGSEERDIPVMYVPFHANTFPLAHGYYEALKKLFKPEWLIEQKIRSEDWKNEMPRLDRSAYYNVFFANEDQKNRWKQKETFHYAKIFEYTHKFVLVNTPVLTSLYKSVANAIGIDTLCLKLITASFKELRIVSDIIPEAEKLRKDIVKEISKAPTPSVIQIKRISIVDAKARSLIDVLNSSNDSLKYTYLARLCVRFLKRHLVIIRK